MKARIAGFVAAMTMVLSGLAGPGVATAQAADPAGTLPSWAKVQTVIADCFRKLPKHQAGGLIVRSEAAEVLGRIQKIGWKVEDGQEILKSVPSDGDFLATALRSPDGRKFMASISSYPDAYDRLDRLSRLPRGQQMVRDLVRGPGGYKLIQYMTEAKGGRALGNQLSRTPRGTDFNKPTGRIYTAAALEKRLQASYEKAAARAAGKQGK